MKIYHNNRCSKSREGLQLLNDKGVEVEVVEYMKHAPSKLDIKDLLAKLNIPAGELIRKGEKIYKEEYKGKEMSEDAWIVAMAEHPQLIERPILVNGNKAVVGRPAEKFLEII